MLFQNQCLLFTRFYARLTYDGNIGKEWNSHGIQRDTYMNWPNASFGIICSYIMKAAFSNEWAAQYRSRVALQNKTMVLQYYYYCQTYYQTLPEARPH